MERLMVRKKELEDSLAQLMNIRKEYDSGLTAGDFIDELDDAQREISTQSYYNLIERKVEELKKVELLITRISKEEEFGLCEECGKPIPEERLLVVPGATLCVPCQREFEKHSHKYDSYSHKYPGSRVGSETDREDSDDLDAEASAMIESQQNTLSAVEPGHTRPEMPFEEKQGEEK
jgi:RNA polymerase-binding transcription factor DksA